MGDKAPAIYQGGDWLTYRLSVAQTFDTLDRVRELCRHVPVAVSNMPHTPGLALPRYEMFDEQMMDLFSCILELCDDLSGEIEAVQADLIPHIQNDVPQRWMGFEMRLHLNEIRQLALQEHQSFEPSNAVLDNIAALAARIRDLLKQIDQ